MARHKRNWTLCCPLTPAQCAPKSTTPYHRQRLTGISYAPYTTEDCKHTHRDVPKAQGKLELRTTYVQIYAYIRRSPAELQNPRKWNPFGSQHDLPSASVTGPAVLSATSASLRFHSRKGGITARFIITIAILLTF